MLLNWRSRRGLFSIDDEDLALFSSQSALHTSPRILRCELGIGSKDFEIFLCSLFSHLVAPWCLGFLQCLLHPRFAPKATISNSIMFDNLASLIPPKILEHVPRFHLKLNCSIFKRLLSGGPIPRHMGIIMDGNRRYAKSKSLQVVHGHRAGAGTLMKVRIDRCMQTLFRFLHLFTQLHKLLTPGARHQLRCRRGKHHGICVFN